MLEYYVSNYVLRELEVPAEYSSWLMIVLFDYPDYDEAYPDWVLEIVSFVLY